MSESMGAPITTPPKHPSPTPSSENGDNPSSQDQSTRSSEEETVWDDASANTTSSSAPDDPQVLSSVVAADGPDSVLPVRSYSKWSPAQQGATLVWRDVCIYATNDRKKKNLGELKRIINNSTGAIQPGTLMALMGSSGAGKSTLMSALAYRNSANTLVQGDILLNGRPVGPFMHRLSGFVHQDDMFMGSLTVIEHLNFMARLRLDRRTTTAQRATLIADLLRRTGLAKSAHSRIGGNEDANKVLSGGEKKRLAFATELLTQPTILFCDEPTTGLDSYGAQQLVRTLQLLARRGTTVMCTIHQPSSQLFAMFHQVLLLSAGRVAFMGSPAQAMDFFASNGYHCPEAYNPADFLVGVLAHAPGCEKASYRASQRLCDMFAVSEVSQQRDMLVNLEMHMSESSELEIRRENETFLNPYWCGTLLVLTHRLMLTVVREPAIHVVRMVQKVVIALMVGGCFYGSIEQTQYGIQALQGALFLIVSENTFSPMYAVLAVFPQAFPLFMRERRSGLYDTVQYYLAHAVAMLPGFIVEPFLFCAVGYWLAGLRPTLYAFSMTSLVAVLVINVAAACGTFFATAFDSVPLAMAYLVPFDYILMITSGNFIKLNTMASYFSWMQYFSWFMYANEAMSIIQWDGVENITCYSPAFPGEDLPCLHTGAAVLEQYSFSGDNLALDLWALLALYIVFNASALFCLWRRTSRDIR